MNIHDNLTTNFLDCLKNSNIATIVGIDSNIWSNNHVFVGQNGTLLGGINRGRKYCGLVERISNDYILLSNVAGGQIDSKYRITFFACTPSNSRSNNSESKLTQMAGKFVYNLRALSNFNQLFWIISNIQNFPFGYKIEVEVTVQNSWNNTTL